MSKKPVRIFLLLFVGLLIVQYLMHVLLVPDVHAEGDQRGRKSIPVNARFITAPPLEQLRKKHSHETTVVTAYYAMHSKRPASEYRRFMKLFLSIKTMPLVVFTDDEGAAIIEEERQFHRHNNSSSTSKGSSGTIGGELTQQQQQQEEDKTTDDTLIRVVRRPFNSWPKMQPAWMKRWNNALLLDKERHHHSPELYAVWASKPDFVLEVAKMLDPFHSQYFVWCDIGIMRFEAEMRVYQNFPHFAGKVLAPRRMNFLEVGYIEQRFVRQWLTRDKQVKGPLPDYALGGGCIAGDLFAWKDFGAGYENALLDMDRRKIFIGKDQTVFFTMLIERRTHYPYRLFQAPPDMNGVVAPWMSFPAKLGGAIRAQIDERFE